MKDIEGIYFVKNKEYAMCHISSFSDKLKEIIREQLVLICHGSSCADSSRKVYNYKYTVKEFLKRYDNKTENTQKGYIGELLIHVLLNEYFPEYETISPFFNMEERSIKKGFDVVLTQKDKASIWITEVKSGELHKDKDANETNEDLLNTAKRDLYSRLNNDGHEAIWMNAVNGAKLAYKSHNDIKDAVIDILEQHLDDATENKIVSSNMNVFLVSVLFSTLNDKVNGTNIEKRKKSMNNEKKFKSLFILSVQKESYSKIYKFIKSEGE